MKSLFIVLSIFFTCLVASAQTPFSGLLQINGKRMFVNYSPAAKNKPTAVFVNGLTYDTKNWARTARYLMAEGYGVVTFDMAGMGWTLLSNTIPSTPILYSQQAKDLKTLLKTLKIRPPYNLVGLSYGGGIISAYTTLYPRDVKNMILIAPYTEFLESQKNILKAQIEMTRKMYPQNPATDEELTDFFIRQLVYTTYPAAEISSLENPYKLEGITRIVQGIRMYQPIEEVNNIPNKSLHLLVAEFDQYIPRDIFEKYWKAVPLRARASRTFIRYSEHKVPDIYPRFTAQFVKGVLDGQPLLFNGDTLEANPITNSIKKAR